MVFRYFNRNVKDRNAGAYFYETVADILAENAAEHLFLSINAGIPAVSTIFQVAGFRRSYRYIEPIVQNDGSTRCEAVSNGLMYEMIEQRVMEI